MNVRDPILTALLFNESINNADLDGLKSLMSKDHTFIDRKGKITEGRESMFKDWVDFFGEFPSYKNTFTRIHSKGNKVILYGYAEWPNEIEKDHAIWVVGIENDLVTLWQIYEDTEENRMKFLI